MRESLRPKLVACADWWLLQGMPQWALSEAKKVYGLLGEAIPRQKLLVLGERCLSTSHLSQALESFRLAGPPHPPELLRLLGSLCAIRGQRDLAQQAYELVGEPLPVESLIACGCWHLCHGRWKDALAAFTDARGPRDKLLVCLDRYSKAFLAEVGHTAVDTDLLIRALEIAGRQDRFCGLARRCCVRGLPAVAQRLSEAAGHPLPANDLLRLGDKYMRKEWWKPGREAYLLAGPAGCERLIEHGEAAMARGHLARAWECFRSAGATDRLLSLADRCAAAWSMPLAQQIYLSLISR